MDRAELADFLRSRRETLRPDEVGSPTPIIHPQVGTISVDCQIFSSQNEIEWLVIFTPLPGSDDVEKLKLLDVIGSQAF